MYISNLQPSIPVTSLQATIAFSPYLESKLQSISSSSSEKKTTMEDARISVPLLNRQAQANFLIPVAAVQDPQTGLPTVITSTPLRWLLYNLEKVLFVDFLPWAVAEVSSDPDSSCPFCHQRYFTTPSEAAGGSNQQGGRVRNERPLRLHCGHIIGRTCLHIILAQSERDRRQCPVCRDQINVCQFIDTILIPTRTRTPDLLAVLRCAIRLYMLIDEASRPETHQGLRLWMNSPLFARETGLNGTRLVWMRAGIEMWDQVGEDIMWELMRNRARGDYLPDSL